MTFTDKINQLTSIVKALISLTFKYALRAIVVVVLLTMVAGLFPDVLGFVITLLFSPLGVIIAIILYIRMKRKSKVRR